MNLSKQKNQLIKYAKIAKIAGIALVLSGVLFASVIQIEPGEVGVQKLFGKVSNNTLSSGLNLKNPLVEIVPFDIKT